MPQHFMRLRKIWGGLLVGSCLAGFTTPAPPAQLHTFQLQSDVQVFPLYLINAFPFIEGEVNGQKGKFMFDTGNASTLSLNNHLLKLPTGQARGQGFVASGQRFTRLLHDTIANVSLTGGLAYRNLLRVESNSFDFLESITPDCIGQIGFGYVANYVFKLDYTQRQLTCYRQTPARQVSRDYLRGERVLAVLDIETRKHPGNVLARVRVGGIPFICGFDTGQQGNVYLDAATRQQLLARGVLVPLAEQDGDTTCTLRAVELARGFKADMHAIYMHSQRNKSLDAALGLTDEPHELHLGYAFLSQFTTIWDTQAGKLYVCAPR